MLDRPAIAAEMPPLFLLPGTLADDTVFAPVLERLGLTSAWMRLAGATSAAEMAKLILATAPPRFTLIGFSLGAIMALEVVAQAPERIERLALLGCNARDLTPEKAAARRATVPVAERLGLTSYIDGVWEASVPDASAERSGASGAVASNGHGHADGCLPRPDRDGDRPCR